MVVLQQMVGPVLVVTIDRPEARNAFDGQTITTLREIFEGISYKEPLPATGSEPAASDEYRPHAVLLRSSGSVFCAGADLDDMKRLGAADFHENLDAALEMGAMFRAIRNCPAPVVCRVQGPAFGGGVGLVCACDVVVAASEARFTLTEVRLGLVAGVIAPVVDLVDRTVEALLCGGPAALGRTKGLVEGALSLGYNRSSEFTAKLIAEARTDGEAQAALAAFFQKQPAPWALDVTWTAGSTDELGEEGST